MQLKSSVKQKTFDPDHPPLVSWLAPQESITILPY